MPNYSLPQRSPHGSVTSNYSLAWSPSQDDPPLRVFGPQQENVPPIPRQPAQGFAVSPPTRLLVEDYLQNARGGQAAISPGAVSAQSFNMAEADPMATHLLLETAMAESQQFKILSPDELDRLKKEEIRVGRMIEAGRKKLYIESRVDNAARQIQRLGSNNGSGQGTPATPISPKKGALLRLRTSIGSTASSDAGSTKSLQTELDSTRMQDLAKEVFKLEKKQVDLHKKKLEHTAGVLQSSYLRVNAKQDELRRKQEEELDAKRMTLDRAFSFTPTDDRTPNLARTPNIGLGIYQSSPFMSDGTMDGFSHDIQVQSRLREVNRKMRGLWTEFDGANATAHPQPPGDRAGPVEQLNYLEDCLQSMTHSHGKLSGLVNEARRRESTQGVSTQQLYNTLEELWTSMSMLDSGARQRESMSPASQTETVSPIERDEPFSLDGFAMKVNSICARAQTLQQQQQSLHNQLLRDRDERDRTISTRDAEKSQLIGQLRAAQDQNAVVQDEVKILEEELSRSNALLRQAQEDIEATRRDCELNYSEDMAKERNTWRAREHELASRLGAGERREGLLKAGIAEHETNIATMKEDHLSKLAALEEALEAKIDNAEDSAARAQAELGEVGSQLEVVGTELLAAENRVAAYEKSSADLERQLTLVKNERAKLQEEVLALQNDLAKVSSELVAAKEQLVAAKEQETKYEASVAHADGQIELLNHEKTQLASQVSHHKNEITMLKQSLHKADQQVAVEREKSGATSQSVADLTRAREELDNETERLRMQIVSLGTAIQEADDRARAAESAAREKTQQILDVESDRNAKADDAEQHQNALQVLRSQFQNFETARNAELHTAQKVHKESEAKAAMLQKEADDMVAHFEDLVRVEVDGEKERVALEGTIDSLRERVAELQIQLDEERVRTMCRSPLQQLNGIGSNAANGLNGVNGMNGVNGHVKDVSSIRSPGESVSVSTMRTEFRRLMKEAKADHIKTLKIEHEERRRLEALVRSLQRDQVRSNSSVPSVDEASLMSASDVFASS